MICFHQNSCEELLKIPETKNFREWVFNSITERIQEKKTKTKDDEVSAAPAVDVPVATNGNGAVGEGNNGDVREVSADNDIQHPVNGLSDVNQSEC